MTKSMVVDLTRRSVQVLDEYKSIIKRIENRADMGYNYVVVEIIELDPRVKVYLEAVGYDITQAVSKPPASVYDSYKITWSLKEIK